jgi:hypothetical protein
LGGSFGVNGILDAKVGTSVQVDKPYWALSCAYSSSGNSDWQEMDAHKIDAEFTPAGGLVVTVGAKASHDFSDFVLQCRSLDPQINAFAPVSIPNFTYPETSKIKTSLDGTTRPGAR